MQRTQVIIVRHGETEWNIRGIRQGHLDSRLTAKGMAQAKALGARLGRERFTALYSSDLGRAVDTAREIADVTGHEIIADARLRERHQIADVVRVAKSNASAPVTDDDALVLAGRCTAVITAIGD